MTQLLKLLAHNKTRQPHSCIVADANETVLYLYDTIVSDDISAEYIGGVSAQTLVPQIRAIKSGTIRLHINSPGGDVFAGLAIAQAIKDTGAKVIAQIDGLAASAATIVAMAADEIEISDGGFFMIHNAWTFAIGNANDLIETAALLQKVDSVIATSYAQRSKLKIEEITTLMDAETWFTAQEALDAQLVDRLTESKKAPSTWDLSAYTNAPKQCIEEEFDPTAHREKQRQRLHMLTLAQIS